MINRRNLLTCSTALLAVGSLGALSNINAYGQTIAVRRNVHSLPPNDTTLRTFAEGVQKMHELPSTDERSWAGQARMHQDHCHRQMGHFTTWHRLYIHSFEEIIRELTGVKNWALPYWNWTDNPQMPLAFFGSNNPLDTTFWNDPNPTTDPDSARSITQNDTIPAAAVGLGKIENQKIFEVFSSRLDLGPHGAIHVAIGGHMRRFLSPLDPIFWLHHCNVDRIWARWSTSFKNPENTVWLSEGFDNMFVNNKGGFITEVKARDLLDTEKLGYVYDDKIEMQIAISALPAQKDISIEFLSTNVTALNAIPSELNIPTNIEVLATDEVLISPTIFDKSSARNGQLGKQIIAKFSDIDIPEDAEDYVIRIFLNCPYLSPEVPPTDPHFVAEINLFSLRAIANFKDKKLKPSALVELTETMVGLNLRQTPVGKNLKVQLIAVSVPNGKPVGTEFKFGRVDIISV